MKTWALRVSTLGSLLLPSLLASHAPAAAAALPASSPKAVGAAGSLATPTQGVYFGFSYGRPYRGYYGPRYYGPRYYGPRYYGYRGYYYGEPPPATYYTRPYVVERARPYRDPDAIARCASRFKSFNAYTGTYITYGGEERLCPYLR